MRSDSVEEILEQLAITRRMLAGRLGLTVQVENDARSVALRLRDLESAIQRELRLRYGDDGEVLPEQRRAQDLLAGASSGSFKAYLALEAEPAVGLDEGDLVLLGGGRFARVAIPSPEAVESASLDREQLATWRDHWTQDRVEEVFLSIYPEERPHYFYEYTAIGALWEAIHDRRTWGRKGPNWSPRLHLLKPHDRSLLIRPPERRRTVSETIVAGSDESAIFELLADCGGRPPVEDRSGGAR